MRILHLFFFIQISSIAVAQIAIDTTEIVIIGGIKQFVSIKGKDRTNPVFLFLHGGPGGSVISYSEKFTSKLQEKFVVIQWDQRETGKTLELNASPLPLTLQLFENDTHDLIEYLLHEFHQNKLYLAGHSWGTTLGFYVADQYPELLYAYIAISPMINQLESERILLERMKKEAKKSNNKVEWEELSTVKVPFENGEQLYFDRKWLSVSNGKPLAEVDKTFPKSYGLSWSDRWLSVWTEASEINLFESLSVINCPVYFFTGRKDYQTNYNITENYYKKLIAPKKGLSWFEHSKHSVPTTEPTLMQQIIIEKILPETLK